MIHRGEVLDLSKSLQTSSRLILPEKTSAS
jgi:hypothetical protein